MENILVYPVGSSDALIYASEFLKHAGVSLVDHPTPEATHLLLDVPSFGPDGMLRGGGDLNYYLRMLPTDITVVGGNLAHPVLDGHKIIDLLRDAEYLARNASITADCALQAAAPLMKTTFADSPALIIGWGRIGKCLGQLLRSFGANVTVAARKEYDRAMLRALGYTAVNISALESMLPRFRLIFNTAPELILSNRHTGLCKNCVKIDLASKPGMEGNDVLWARGLPGIYAPESSGKLIAETFLRLYREGSS